MNPLLEEVFVTRKFVNSNGQTIEIHSETPRDQCHFLQKIIEDNRFSKTLEVGLAYGLSTLAICESVAKFSGTHTAFDPAENSYWGGNGVELVNQAGYGHVLNFQEKTSVAGFAELLAQGKQYDFAYVDTAKLFDWILVDFYFIARLLRIGGIVVFDDVDFPGIRKVMRFIAQLDHFKVYAAHPKNEEMKEGKLPKLLNRWSRSSYLIKEEYKQTDYSLGINARCVAFQKTDEDRRRWDWHKPF